MIIEKLLEKIGFTDEEIEKYTEVDSIEGEKIEKYAEKYMAYNMELNTVLEEMEDETFSLSKYTINLLFVLRCTGYYRNNLLKKDISEEMIINNLKDIKCKLDECQKRYDEFGIMSISWYNLLFRENRYQLGRLQFEIEVHEGGDVTYAGHTLNNGQLKLKCHIPSLGPLTKESCMDSYRKAYGFYKDYFKDGILRITLGTWLLYPPYKDVFAPDSNTAALRKDYHIFRVRENKNFKDGWRVFGKDITEFNTLPGGTSLQRKMAQYIENGGTFGEGDGVLFFDGERIITKE